MNYYKHQKPNINNILYKSEISKKNKSYMKSNNLYLPYISTNVVRKSNNMKSLKQIIDNNNLKKIENFVNEKRITTSNNKKNDRDIFKNINFFINNKKSKINVNDIQRNISLNSGEDEYENNKKKLLYERKNSESDKKNESLLNKNISIDEDLIKMKENEKFIIYEGSKKLIDTYKFTNSKIIRLANIPNVSLDKGFKNVKEFESNVKNMKNISLDLPICIKLKKQN